MPDAIRCSNLYTALAWLLWAIHYQDHAIKCPRGCLYIGTSNARELRSLRGKHVQA